MGEDYPFAGFIEKIIGGSFCQIIFRLVVGGRDPDVRRILFACALKIIDYFLDRQSRVENVIDHQ